MATAAAQISQTSRGVPVSLSSRGFSDLILPPLHQLPHPCRVISVKNASAHSGVQGKNLAAILVPSFSFFPQIQSFMKNCPFYLLLAKVHTSLPPHFHHLKEPISSPGWGYLSVGPVHGLSLPSGRAFDLVPCLPASSHFMLSLFLRAPSDSSCSSFKMLCTPTQGLCNAKCIPK